MVIFSNLQVDHFERNVLHIQWEVSMDNEDVGEYSYGVYRSESQANGFELVSGLAEDARKFIDGSVNTFKIGRTYFYKIIATRIDNTTLKVESDPGWVGSDPDCIALDIVRRERLLLRQYLKVKCYVLTARTTGARCPNCWNPVRKRISRSNCTVCQGTGFAKGFYTMEPTYFKFNPSPKMLRASGMGPLEKGETNAWTSNFPILKSNDYIIEVGNGNIWRVKSMVTSEKSRYIIRQMVAVKAEEKGSELYDIKLPSVWIEPWECNEITGVPTE